jgi:uncharacterized protein (TIGR02145 family)
VSNQGNLSGLSLPTEPTEICNTNLGSPDCTDLVDLSTLVDEGYVNSLPVDPQATGDGTGYEVAEGSIILVAPLAETRFIGIGTTESEYAGGGGATFVCGDGVDYGGYSYSTVNIGEQCWFAENLKTTQYSNGEEIPYAYDDNGSGDYAWSDASGLGNGVRTCAENDCPANQDTYGFLYNWYVVEDSRGVCPDGWEVPSHNEWSDLERFICMDQGGSEANCSDAFPYLGEGGDPTGHRIVNEEGKHLRSTDFWSGYDTYGFNALPGANYVLVMGMSYNTVGDTAFFWTTDFSHEDSGYDYYWQRSLHPGYHEEGVSRGTNPSYDGYSIRCLKN